MDAGLRNLFTNIEKNFNIAGCIPVVSLLSGAMRAIAGKIQVIVGAVIATTGFINLMITQNSRWEKWVNLGSELMIHGTLNIFRGLGEALLCGTTGVGNVVLLIPNMNKDDMFSPYLAYGTVANENCVCFS
ncbi:MAG TPA: hypothetical protein VGP47_11200 [Parachlamydiaceae bacterium]|nr:hypothetical protein [Parachlamydiaceae bacterium]